MLADLPHYDGNARSLREMFSYFPSGVAALLAEIDGKPTGIIASSFTVGVSIDPPLVSCAIRRASTTWPELRRASNIGISVLAEDQGAMARQIASRQADERFVEVPLRNTGSSARFIAGAPVWFECTFAEEHPAGDHTIVLLEVHRGGADPTLKPLVFYGSAFRRLLLPPHDA